MAENTIKTRIQLKCDTEANWKQAVLTSDNPEGTKNTGKSFIPKKGEAIIFSSDSTHPFSRLKIGDGITDVLSLPFIDSGSINGKGIDTDISNNPTSQNLPTTSAVVNFISAKTAGLTGAMHFKGKLDTIPVATESTTFETYESGDVILYNEQEYVYNKGNDENHSSWILLGDEGSYALKSNTTSVISSITFSAPEAHYITSWNPGSTPSFGEAFRVPNVTSVGSSPSLSFSPVSCSTVSSIKSVFLSASLLSGVLSFSKGEPISTMATNFSLIHDWTPGSIPSLSDPFIIPYVTSVGTSPSLSYTSVSSSLSFTSTQVVIPGNNSGGD